MSNGELKLREKPVHIAIIGAGGVSEYHHVPGITLDPRAEVVAVCDRDTQLITKRQDQWGVVKGAIEVDEIVEDPEIDAVIIATPTSPIDPLRSRQPRQGSTFCAKNRCGSMRRRPKKCTWRQIGPE